MAGELIDLVNQPLVKNALPPVVLAATSQGSAIDMESAMTPLGAIVKAGAFGANTTSGNVQIEECSTTNGTFTVISGMVCTITASNQIFLLKGMRQQRYVRANAVTVTGTTVSIATDVTILQQLKYTGGSADLGGISRSPSS